MENEIHPSEKLRAIFEALWLNYVPKNSKYAIVPWTPFWHLKNEPFWHFKAKEVGLDIDTLAEPGQTAKIGDIRDKISYAYLDQELFDILQDKNLREILEHQLVDMYLS